MKRRKKKMLSAPSKIFLPLILSIANIGIGFSAWVYPQVSTIATGTISVNLGTMEQQRMLIRCTNVDIGASTCTFGNVFKTSENKNGTDYFYMSKLAPYNEFYLNYSLDLNNNNYKASVRNGYDPSFIFFRYSIDVKGLNAPVENYIGLNNGLVLLNGEGWHKKDDTGRPLQYQEIDGYSHQKISHAGDFAIRNHGIESGGRIVQTTTNFYLKYFFLASMLDKPNGRISFDFNFLLRSV